jgi:elongation factor Tu
MDNVDSYIPTQLVKLKTILMAIEDVLTRGTVATGRIERGQVNVGDTVELVGMAETKTTTVTGLEMFQKNIRFRTGWRQHWYLITRCSKADISRGMVLSKPGSSHIQNSMEVYILTKDEGGRHTSIFKGYRPQFYVRTTDVTGAISEFSLMEKYLKW